MKIAPEWWLKGFEKSGYNVADPTTRAQLSVYWTLLREGRKRMYTDTDVLGDDSPSFLTSYGRKTMKTRRRAAQLAKQSRRANQRKAAIVRRKRQKRVRRFSR
jgi:hypothetical protein